MLHAFLTYINEQKLCLPSDKILLTVSGGKDSMAMLDLFCKAKLSFSVAHCNFQLRGKDADGDQIFVEQICKERGITFYTKTFETKIFAKKNKISIEMAARSLRYEWFESLRTAQDFAYIATAHHLNDSIETVLLNLTKGTGISGLKGILPKNGFIIRPLLFLSRQEIDEYVAKENIAWREDISNASNDYQRNLLRNKVVPLLKQINPNFEATFARNLERFQSLNIDFQKNLEHFKASVMREEKGIFYLKIDHIFYWQAANYYLEEVLKTFDFNVFQAKEIFQLLSEKTSGKNFFSPSYNLLKNRNELIISKIKDKNKITNNDYFYIKQANTDEEIIETKDLKLKVSVIDISDLDKNLLKNKNIFFADLASFSFPLKIRNWQQGDVFMPFGMKGKKKVSDFLIDTKISLNQKKEVLILASEDSIMWLIGLRSDERFKIKNTTKKIFKVEIL